MKGYFLPFIGCVALVVISVFTYLMCSGNGRLLLNPKIPHFKKFFIDSYTNTNSSKPDKDGIQRESDFSIATLPNKSDYIANKHLPIALETRLSKRTIKSSSYAPQTTLKTKLQKGVANVLQVSTKAVAKPPRTKIVSQVLTKPAAFRKVSTNIVKLTHILTTQKPTAQLVEQSENTVIEEKTQPSNVGTIARQGSKEIVKIEPTLQAVEVTASKKGTQFTNDKKVLNSATIHQPTTEKNMQQKGSKGDDTNPWNGVPEFIFYVRFTSDIRWEKEYKDVLIRTMKIFVPQERAKLLIVLDDERQADHQLGERLKQEWPHPKICYRPPGDRMIYSRNGKSRMFWDMMHPDKCTNVPYVGFIDTDTFFSTLLTPNLLFEDGKPIIIAKIGKPPYPCWEDATEKFLGKKEVMQCMSTFPVMIKTEHMKEMRQVLEKEQGRNFGTIFRNSTEGGPWGALCLCQFSIMCNYVWYYHRNEYSWHLQIVPDGNWKGESWVPSQVKPEYYNTEVKPEMKIPIPRSSIHLRYTITDGAIYEKREPPHDAIEGFISEGLCYSGGFTYCPEQCQKWNKHKVHYNLYSFETYQWFWDKRCLPEQKKHYRNVEKLVNYYVRKKIPVFNVGSIDEICKHI